MIQELTKKREDHIKSCRANNDNSHQIIADMYSDPSHFIYELLQNAEDAEASSIEFLLSTEKLIVKHNGRNFDFDDIDAITSIGNSTKRNEVNKIGKFGAGFKSVFSITNSPQIYSGQYNFEIVDFIIPNEFENRNVENTEFIFPFNHKKRKPDEIYTLIRDKLKVLENEILLFLKNIKTIIWETNEENGVYLKEHQNKQEYENIFHEKVFVTSEINNEENNDTEYYLFSNDLILQNKNLTVNIAYKIEDNQIVEADSPYLSVYFPTKIETDLNFLLHAPYKTTPSRETIPFDDPDNEKLTNQLAKLFTKSLLILKNNNFINARFLDTLPLKDYYYKKHIYSALHSELVAFFKEYSILPTVNGEFVKASDAILARGKDLTNLLNTDDLNNLFQRKYWLSPEITRDKTTDLRTFLIDELEIPEVEFEDFAIEINVDFLDNKADEWLIYFYSLLVNQNSLLNKKGILRYRNIFKLENEEFASLYDNNDRLNIYLPRKDKSNYKVIKKVFIENEQSKAFFDKYNVNYPDRLAELKEFIAPKYKYSHETPIDEFISDWEKIIAAYNNADKTKQDIVDLFENKYIILTCNSDYQKPYDTYIPTQKLKKWFENQKVNFISNEIFTENNILFFEKIGCCLLPKRIEIESKLTHSEKESLTNGYHSKWGLNEKETLDFHIEGLDNILQNISFENSKLIFELLEKNYIKYSHWNKRNFFKGVFKWSYYGEQSKYYPAFFLKQLNENSWLLNKENEFVKSCEITIEELSDEYAADDNFFKAIDELFSFKTDEVKKLEDKGYYVVSKEEKDEFEKWKQQQNEQKEQEKTEWTPKFKPEEVKITVEKFENVIEQEDLSNQVNDKLEDDDTTEDLPKTLKTRKKTTSKNKHSKEIGEWGEEAAQIYLSEKFNSDYEILWLNKNENVGKGYDFVVRKNNFEEFYYEIKTKTENKPELMEISGTQWEWARTLYDKGEGNKYIICVILGAGHNEEVKIQEIQNPIEKWKNGQLKANPVNFEI